MSAVLFKNIISFVIFITQYYLTVRKICLMSKIISFYVLLWMTIKNIILCDPLTVSLECLLSLSLSLSLSFKHKLPLPPSIPSFLLDSAFYALLPFIFSCKIQFVYIFHSTFHSSNRIRINSPSLILALLYPNSCNGSLLRWYKLRCRD